jgi:hypothetical protein
VLRDRALVGVPLRPAADPLVICREEASLRRRRMTGDSPQRLTVSLSDASASSRTRGEAHSSSRRSPRDWRAVVAAASF